MRKIIDGTTGLEIDVDNETRRLYARLIRAATKSRPTPYISGYHVRTAGMTESGHVVVGGNHELKKRKNGTITHGEEAVIARAIDDYGEDDKIKVIAFATDFEASGITPCGGCRDPINQHCSDDAIFLAGRPSGGNITVMPKKAFFFDDFRYKASSPLSNTLLPSRARLAAHAGVSNLETLDDAYIPYLDEDQRKGLYGAVLYTSSGRQLQGSMFSTVSWHGIGPIASAVVHYRNARGPRKGTPERLIVLAHGQPEVDYLERQFLQELVDLKQAYRGTHSPLPVALVNVDAKEVCFTNTKEWYPHPFSPLALGIDRNKLREQAKKVFRNC